MRISTQYQFYSSTFKSLTYSLLKTELSESQVNVKLNLAFILQKKAQEDPRSCTIKAA